MTVSRRLVVLIVDPNDIFRAGCRALFGSDARFQIAADVPSVETASAVRSRAVDLVVLDPDVEGRPEVARVAAVRSAHPHAALLLLTHDPDREFLVRATEVGARAILLKARLSPSYLLDVAELVARSSATVLDRSVLLDLARNGSPYGGAAPRLAIVLTHRELEILALLARGLTDQEIARALHVARTTVHSHVSSMLRKASATNRVQLGIAALRHGLIVEEPPTALEAHSG